MKESSSLSPLFISLNIATQLTDSDALVHRKELDLADLQLHLFKQSHSMMCYMWNCSLLQSSCLPKDLLHSCFLAVT